jgi:acyl-CoA synthetase (AMP-forming)/AMP-acid ligase II
LPQGPAAPGEELKIVDEQGKERDAWEIGEILARGQTMFVEYVDKPERTKEVIDEEGWMHTGDLGMLDARGYIYVYGRKEYTIASGGNRVPPSMVEAVLATHPAVKESITIGVPYKELGEAIKSIVVLRPEKKATTEELLDFCRERLPSYAVPKSLIIVDEIPKGAKSLPKMAEIKERWGEEL